MQNNLSNITAHIKTAKANENINYILKVEQLNAWFSNKAIHAIKNINIDILQNQVTAIIGPSGCGKSTFIRCLNRLHEEVVGADVEGKVLFNNKNIYDVGIDPVVIRRKIGMVFQKPNPFPALSIFENVTIGLKLLGVKQKNVLKEIAEQSLKLAALWDEVKDKLYDYGTSISGGQQQRLCIARALAVNPSILLLDEPTSALDPISTAKIEELISDLKSKVTIIIVTHNMQQAARIADKTAFFLNGNLIEFDYTSKIFTNPSHKETEYYITGRFG